MADASCSGTTPFKRLVDHQGRDVSHHQDRLVNQSQAYSHGSFRSTAQTGQAQQGFDAFMNGAVPGMPHPNESAARLSAHAAALRHAPTPDFSLRGAPPSRPELGVLPARASPAPDMTNWAADFARFSNPHEAPLRPGPAHQSAPYMQARHMQSQFNVQTPFGLPALGAQAFPGPNGSMGSQPEFDQELSRWMAIYGSGAGMEAVDAAMEQMARELEPLASTAGGIVTAKEESPISDHEARIAPAIAKDQIETHFTDLETPEIGSLSLQPSVTQETAADVQQKEKDPQKHQAGRSAVSEAAERLLESVKAEDGDKWKNSTFLSLMRDFRDGRKDIVDNEVRQTHAGGDDASLS